MRVYKIGGNVGLRKGYFRIKKYNFTKSNIKYIDFVRDENGKLRRNTYV